MFLILWAFVAIACNSQTNENVQKVDSINGTISERLAQEQLVAYNNRDIEAFLVPYSEDVKIYSFQGELMMSGKQAMRERYSTMFANTPDLHCELLNRIVQDDTVIDHEMVTFKADEPPRYAIAIYKIKNEKIAEVYFIQ